MTKKTKGMTMRWNLSLYNAFVGISLRILLRYSNPPEMKMNNGMRIG